MTPKLPKTVLVTGGRGQLGRAISREAQRKGYLVFSFGRDKLDVTDRDAVFNTITSLKPDIVINCAAFTDVDGAEKERDAAMAVNCDALYTLSELSDELGFFLVHFSTDYVFDGEKGSPYSEEDRPNPINFYGLSKLKGEEAVRDTLGGNYLIFRVSWVFGEGERNFPAKLISWSRKNNVLRVVDDQVSSPSYTADLARATLKACEVGLSGLFHMCNGGYCSRYEWARFILRELGWEGEILPAKSEDFPSPARRPAFSALLTEKLSAAGIDLPPWEDATRRFVREVLEVS